VTDPGTTIADELSDITEFELLTLLANEFGDGGLAINVVDTRKDAPAQLILTIAMPPGAPGAVINTYFMPGVRDPSAIEHFVTLAYEVAPGNEAVVATTVCFVNTLLPMTGFEYSIDDQVMVFRHTHAVSLYPLDPSIIASGLSMVHADVANFAPVLGNVAATGDADASFAAAQAIVDELAP
jgi:hypothetical protein